jgi:hypothetical protein
MAWTAPRTWVEGETITAALLNTHLRDNMLETEAALATGGLTGGYFVGNSTNDIVERKAGYGQTLGTTTTSSSTYTGVAPTVTVTSSDRALVLWSANFSEDTANRSCWCSVAVSGATTIAATDDTSLAGSSVAANRDRQMMSIKWFNTLNAGSNIFTMQYHVQGGVGVGTWSERRLFVLPF